jgi:hypothetical protein
LCDPPPPFCRFGSIQNRILRGKKGENPGSKTVRANRGGHADFGVTPPWFAIWLEVGDGGRNGVLMAAVYIGNIQNPGKLNIGNIQICGRLREMARFTFFQDALGG